MRQRSLAVPRIPLLTTLLAATLLTVAPQALAEFGVLSGSVGSFSPPTADGTAVEDFTVDHLGYSLWVSERGVYTVLSERIQEPFPGRLLLHRGPIDLDDPLDRLIAVADYDDAGEGASFDVVLEAGVVYYVSTTLSEPDATSIYDFDYGITGGPSPAQRSACTPPGDDVEALDYGQELTLAEEFCAEIDWRDHQGNTGRGNAVPYRSADTGLFWFFDPDNWEVQIKVLDGCAVNGHFWIFYSATTDVEFDLYVVPRNAGYRTGRVYRNELGHTAETVTNTTAFPCEG
jgi:hypothetical protein